MPISCPDCTATMPDDAAYCPGCGRAIGDLDRAHGTVGVLPETIAGALAYFLLPAIVFLLAGPYNRNRFVRFHSVQSIASWLTAIVIAAALRTATAVLGFIPLLGTLAAWLLWMLMSLAFFMIWVVLLVKALQGEMFELPIIGDLAAHQAART
jgi:uncharacterized membrane protein